MLKPQERDDVKRCFQNVQDQQVEMGPDLEQTNGSIGTALQEVISDGVKP